MSKKFADAGNQCQWPDLEMALKQWVKDLQKSGYIVTRKRLKKHAKVLAKRNMITNFCWEDWCTNFIKRNGFKVSRKKKKKSRLGPNTGTSAFGTTGYGTSGTGGLFGQSSSTAPSLFGTTTNAQSSGLFGATGSTFGQPAASTGSTLFGQTAFGQQQGDGLYGAKPAGFDFGQSATTGLGTPGFGTTGTSTFFGSKPTGFTGWTLGTTLGAGAGTGLFGETAGLGGTSALGSTAFERGTLGALGSQTAGGLSTLGSNQNIALLAQQQQELQRQVLALTSSPYGDSPLFRNSLLDKSKVEKASTTTTSTQKLGGSPSHYKVMARPAARIKSRPINSTTMNKGDGLYGAKPAGTLGALGSQTAGGLSTLGSNQNIALLAQQQQELQRQVLALTSSPYGDSPLFRNSLLDKSKVEKASTTTTSTQKLGGSPSHYKVMARPAARIKSRPINSTTMNKSKFFEGLDDDSGISPDTFVPRRSIKKLIIRRKTGSEESPSVGQIDGNPRLCSLEDSADLCTSSSLSPARAIRATPTRTTRDSDERENGTPLGVRFSGIVHTARFDDTIADLNVQPRKEIREGLVEETTSQTGTEDNVDQGAMVAMVSPSGRKPSKPSGVTLTRPDYYCIPPVDEMNSQIDDNGDIWVKDLIVAREGYGQAKFFGWTNVAGLDLDAIITFRRREIEVYPDNYTNKPPVGEGLNKKTEITLEKVWPNDKSTHQPIRSPERLKLQGWQERIEKATASLGAVFFDYQMDTGKWVFTVEHFTRYGMHDELEDESVLKKQKRQPIRTGDQLEQEPKEEANLPTHVVAPHINKLPMPEDCLLVERDRSRNPVAMGIL